MPKPTAPESIAALGELSLGDERKARMRAELSAYADLHAARAPLARRAVPSPFLSMRLWYGVASFVLLLLVGGTGAAYASGSTLPGDTLYPVKVAIAEPIESALTPAPADKAKLHVAFAERRLEEATQLAAKDKLDPATQSFLAAQMDAQVRDSSQLADQLAQSGQDAAAVSVRTDLSARLAAHAELLSLIATNLEQKAAATADRSAGETAAQALALADTARAHESAVADDTAPVAEAAVETATSSLQTVAVAEENANVAVHALRVAAVAAESASSTPEPAAVPAIAEQVTQAESHLTDAKDQLGQEQPRAAARDAQEAAKDSEVAAIILQHESLLKALGITATTTASSTQASTTPRAVRAHSKDGKNDLNLSGTTSLQEEASSSEDGSSARRPLWMRLVAPILGS